MHRPHNGAVAWLMKGMHANGAARGVFRLVINLLASTWTTTCQQVSHSPFVYHMRLVQLNAIAGIARIADHQTGLQRAAMLGTTAAGIVLVQIMGERVPASAHAHHHMRAQDLQIEDDQVRPILIEDSILFRLKELNFDIVYNRFSEIKQTYR